jgi:hypothetical protein
MHTRPCAEGFAPPYPDPADVRWSALADVRPDAPRWLAFAVADSALRSHPWFGVWAALDRLDAEALWAALLSQDVPAPPPHLWTRERLGDDDVAGMAGNLRLRPLVAAPHAPPALVAA